MGLSGPDNYVLLFDEIFPEFTILHLIYRYT